jgi:3-oxoacyl-[acyl-carrier-protein] synthase II
MQPLRDVFSSDPVLPAPLEQQLEAIVEDALVPVPLPEPALITPDADRHRVVVTGMGVVSPVGNTVADFWASLTHGRSGISFNDLVPNVRDYPSHVAGIVRGFDADAYMDNGAASHMSRAAQFAVASARQALDDAGLQVDDGNADEIGVVLGGSVALPEAEQAVRTLVEHGGAAINAAAAAAMLPNMPAAQIGALLGLRGYTTTIATACAASAQALGEAMELLQRGDADVLLAGGAEGGICELTLAAFSAMGALATQNDEPARASRPFDATRTGFVLGEGAAVLVLETLAHARARGATIYGELIGYGVSSGVVDLADPDPVGEGAVRAMERALRRANIMPQQVDYVNAHAAGTPRGDAGETEAIKTVFGEYASTIPVSDTKGMTGHLLSAAGALEAVATVLALKHGVLPPTINYETPDPHCDLDYVPNTARSAPIAIALSNSCGFGGQNASLIFQKYTDERRLSPAELAVEAEIEGWIDEQ